MRTASWVIIVPIRIAYEKIMANLKALALLNGLTPAQFLAEYWQKKPLLVKNAIADFKGLLSPDELADLACEEDVQARIIRQVKADWRVQHGPFTESDFAKLPQKNWTLLVQSINHFLPEAADLLSQFNFIPHARLDDLMVSYAPNGGGVGPHVDSYDVFLLQGSGKRNWKISAQKQLTLQKNQPIKVLSHFETAQEWILEPGDMLYLPPQIAHWGTAVGDDCMTYSIGFRAPKTQELMHEFLNYLQDNIQTEGLYADPDLQVQNHPAEISHSMIVNVEKMLKNIQWQQNTVANFLGRYLTEPKLDVVFEAPRKISLDAFTSQLGKKTLRLSLKSQLLFTSTHFYLNGEKLDVPGQLSSCLQDFADQRQLSTQALPADTIKLLSETLYASFLAGFLCFEQR